MTDHQRETKVRRRPKVAEATSAALEKGIAEVRTAEQADQVIAHLNAAAAGLTEPKVAAATPAPIGANEPARNISRAAETASGENRAEAVITEVARQIAAADDLGEESIAEGVLAATNPQPVGGAAKQLQRQRMLLHEALLRDLGPFKAADVELFLRVNHLPHPRWFNQLMSGLTKITLRGDAWVVALLVAALFNRRQGKKVLIDVVPPLWLATATVEYPIKYFFRRRRPFVRLLQAIVVGKKPGSYSFPSGHSASSFAAAALVTRHYPRFAPLFFFLATLVGFSRIYLGAHYPSDVITGATSGTFFAEAYRRLCRRLLRRV